jgi:hypothetical protein
MKKRFGQIGVWSCLIIMQALHGSDNGQQISNQESSSTSQAAMIHSLGKNRLAQSAAWVSFICSSYMSAFVSYKTLSEFLDKCFLQIPFIKDYHEGLARNASVIILTPAVLVMLMKYASLSWYFYYMLYSGERASPLLAQEALRNLTLYVHHLKVVKSVQKELLEVIDQINQALKEQTKQSASIDPLLLTQLEETISHNEAYIQQVLLQLHQFLSDEDIHQYTDYEQMLFLSEIEKSNSASSATADLEEQMHTIVHHLQTSGIDWGYDCMLLNHLIQELIDYWQQYTIGLAEGIDNALHFCQNVYFVEQVIINVLDRTLVSR